MGNKSVMTWISDKDDEKKAMLHRVPRVSKRRKDEARKVQKMARRRNRD